MNNAEKDQLIEDVNRAVVKSAVNSPKRKKLEILQRRYLGGERSDALFRAMEIETADNSPRDALRQDYHGFKDFI